MKWTLLFWAFCAVFLIIGFWACASKTNTSPSNDGGNVTVSGVVTVGPGLSYSPSSVTIPHGNAVAWVGGGGHTVMVDNGKGTGTCSTYSSFPVTQVFSQPGTFMYHCTVPGHASCSASSTPPASTSCGLSCTGMIGTVVVQ